MHLAAIASQEEQIALFPVAVCGQRLRSDIRMLSSYYLWWADVHFMNACCAWAQNSVSPGSRASDTSQFGSILEEFAKLADFIFRDNKSIYSPSHIFLLLKEILSSMKEKRRLKYSYLLASHS